MKKELRDKLLEDFPDLFSKEDPLYRKGSGITMSIDCEDGWFELIYELCTDLRKIVKRTKQLDSIQVLQVKEKFGGLRFYIGSATGEVFNRIHRAEDSSYHICEFCGAAGKVRNLPWIRTLCDKCYGKELKRYEK